jgi:hypothetical protein
LFFGAEVVAEPLSEPFLATVAAHIYSEHVLVCWSCLFFGADIDADPLSDPLPVAVLCSVGFDCGVTR